MQPLTFDKDHFGQIAERLRIRLDLASFKCQHGYQDMDFYSMESVFRPCSTTTPTRKGTPRSRDSPKGEHHYYPLYHHDNHPKKKKKHIQQQQSLGSCLGQTIPAFLHSPPLSAKRSTSPSRTDELTAQLLLWLCHSSGNAA
ncbi:hypothetical protein [Absidia glauca]|uniref:Uncharacterized protein n=1 Tax=Absidia glauca TaxID=4829 RepID=A0A168MD37_ABSGL|nr:hypothetical protein [Absidia glauca]